MKILYKSELVVMKIAFFIMLFFIIFSANVSSQTIEIIKSGTQTEDEVNVQSNTIFRKYYFNEKSVDSAIFIRDSILLSKEKMSIESSRLELYTDSKFRFIYNVNIDTVKIKDPQDGAVIVQIYEKNDEINGNYGLSRVSISKNEQKDIDLRLIFNNNHFIDYEIIDLNYQMILKKKNR